MFAVERQEIICQILMQKGSVSLSELTKKFAVSVETVRRDLLILERRGKLHRIHGGAVTCTGVKERKTLSARMDEYEKEKKELAAYACTLVKEGDFIAVDGGSTALQFCCALVGNFSSLTVIVHSTDAFDVLRQNSGFQLILAGGSYNREERSFVGSSTVEMIRKYHVSKCFLAPDAVSLTYGLTVYQDALAEVERTYIGIADQTVVLANSQKFEQNAFLRVTEVKESFLYVTDSALPEVIRQAYREQGLEIIAEG